MTKKTPQRKGAGPLAGIALAVFVVLTGMAVVMLGYWLI